MLSNRVTRQTRFRVFRANDNTGTCIICHPLGEPTSEVVRNISPYLIPGPNIIVHPRGAPLCAQVPEMVNGSKPTDKGNYLFTPEEKQVFLELEPGAKKFFNRCIGAEEFINGVERWCLWLKDADPTELRQLPHVLKRIEAVREFRASSFKNRYTQGCGSRH